MSHFNPPATYLHLQKEIDEDLEPIEWNDVIWLPLTTAEDYHECPSEHLPRCCDVPESIVVFAKDSGGNPWCLDTSRMNDGELEVCQVGPSWDLPIAPGFSWFLLRQFALMLCDENAWGGEERITEHFNKLQSVLDTELMSIASELMVGSKDMSQYASFVRTYLPSRYHIHESGGQLPS